VRGPDRVNSRNGYRHRELDTRVGTLDVAVPKLREGTYFPEWLLERRRRAEAALTSVVATCYLLGVSTRRMDRLVQSLGITGLSRSQVSVMAKDLDELVRDFRERPLDEGPYTFLAADALTMRVREGGRVIKIAVMVATGVNADGFREILGVATSTAESGAGWNNFFKDLVARALNGVALVTSDAHAGLVDAIGANLPGASWQRCRTHYTANLMSVCPKHAWGGVKAMLHSVFDQIDAAAVHTQYDKLLDQVEHTCRPCMRTSTPAGTRFLPSPRSPRTSGDRSGPSTSTNASTAKSGAVPTSSASSPTEVRSSASSAPSWPNNTTNGPTAAATSASKYSTKADSPSSPPTPRTTPRQPPRSAPNHTTTKDQTSYTTSGT
jgi:transposase-like protein